MPLHLPETPSNSPDLVRRIIVRLNGLLSSVGTYLGIMPTSSPQLALDGGILWVANSAGTQNGQAYDIGDLLVTLRVGTVTKTILIVDFSAA